MNRAGLLLLLLHGSLLQTLEKRGWMLFETRRRLRKLKPDMFDTRGRCLPGYITPCQRRRQQPPERCSSTENLSMRTYFPAQNRTGWGGGQMQTAMLTNCSDEGASRPWSPLPSNRVPDGESSSGPLETSSPSLSSDSAGPSQATCGPRGAKLLAP